MDSSPEAYAGHIVDFRVRPSFGLSHRMFVQEFAAAFAKFKAEVPEEVSSADFHASLDRAGVALAVYVGRSLPASGLDVDRSNEEIAEVAEGSAGRILAFASVDVRRMDLRQQVLNAMRHPCMRGIAIDPQIDGLSILSRDYTIVFENADEMGFPVIITGGPFSLKFAGPIDVDRLAVQYPGVRIIVSHGLWPSTSEMFAVAFARANVFLETSLYLDMPLVGESIRTIAHHLADRIIYASGYPLAPLTTWAEIRGLGIAEPELSLMLGGNARRLLGGPIVAAAESHDAAGTVTEQPEQRGPRG